MTPVAISRRGPVGLALPVLLAASVCHFLNDATQSLFTASYPIFRSGFDLSFGQIGLLTLAYQLSASILQPMIGLYTDRRPAPYSLPVGMGFSAAALVTLAFAPSYLVVVAGAALLGVGSSIFHPESSRLARLASGGAHGLAQSIFQVGGNIGSSVGPLLVAFIVLPGGQSRLAWFAVLALSGIAILSRLSAMVRWRAAETGRARRGAARRLAPGAQGRPGDGDPRRADLLEIFLHREFHELLHVLSGETAFRPPSGPRKCACSCSSAPWRSGR